VKVRTLATSDVNNITEQITKALPRGALVESVIVMACYENAAGDKATTKTMDEPIMGFGPNDAY